MEGRGGEAPPWSASLVRHQYNKSNRRMNISIRRKMDGPTSPPPHRTRCLSVSLSYGAVRVCCAASSSDSPAVLCFFSSALVVYLVSELLSSIASGFLTAVIAIRSRVTKKWSRLTSASTLRLVGIDPNHLENMTNFNIQHRHT